MNGQVITYGLAIILDNDISICCPYQILNGRKSIDNIESIRIPSVLCFSKSGITIGNVITDESEKEQVEYVCGFIRAFQGQLSEELIAEIKKRCSCAVNDSVGGNVEYVIRHLHNQTFTPAILLQLFLQFAVRHEEARVGIPVRELVIIHPPSFSDVHVEYLNHILQSFSQCKVVVMNRLICEISSFLPSAIMDLTEPKQVLLFHCTFSAFHIYACSINNHSVHIEKHAVCTGFSKNSIISRMRDLVIRQYNADMKDTLPKSTYRSVYTACNTVLEKLSFQSLASVTIYVNEERFIFRFTDFIMNALTDHIKNNLSEDMNKLLEEIGWNKSNLYSVIVSGDCYNVICYRQWVSQQFPSIYAFFANDITEFLYNGIHPSIRMTAEEFAPNQLYQVIQSAHARQPLSKEIIKALEDNELDENVEAIPAEPEKSIVFDELSSISFKIVVPSDEKEQVYCPSIQANKSRRNDHLAVEVESAKAGSTVTVATRRSLRSSTRQASSKKQKVVEEKEDELGSEVFDSDREDFAMIQQLLEDDEEEKSEPAPKKERVLPKRESKRKVDKPQQPNVSVKEEKEGSGEVEVKTRKRKTQIEQIQEETAAITNGELFLQPRQAGKKALEATKQQLSAHRRKKREREEETEEKTAKKGKRGKVKQPEVTTHSYTLPPIPATRIPKDLTIQHFVTPSFTKYRIVLWKGSSRRNAISNLCDDLYLNNALNEMIPSKLALPFIYKDGSKYEGSIHASMRHGSGVLTYSNGVIYKGQFKENKRHGKGLVIYNNTHVFEGVFDMDAPKKGKLFYPNKACYEGTFNAKGQPHGKGTFYSNGQNATWDGPWVDGEPNGEGTFFYDDGNYFIGTLHFGKRSGAGALYNKRGSILLSCHYVNDLEEGEGTIYYPKIGSIRTSFEHGKIDGDSVMINEKGEEIGRGHFKNNSYSGKGKIYLGNNLWYTGAIASNQFSGQGTYYFDASLYLEGNFQNNSTADNVRLFSNNILLFKGQLSNSMINGFGCEFYDNQSKMYEGNLSSGLRNGKGTLVFEDGTYYQGMFKYGFVSGTGTIFDKEGKNILSAKFAKGEIIYKK